MLYYLESSGILRTFLLLVMGGGGEYQNGKIHILLQIIIHPYNSLQISSSLGKYWGDRGDPKVGIPSRHRGDSKNLLFTAQKNLRKVGALSCIAVSKIEYLKTPYRL